MLADDLRDIMGPLRYMDGWTDAQWADHDAGIQSLADREAREARAAIVEHNRALMRAQDAPRDSIDPRGGFRDTAATVELAHALATPGKRLVVLAGGVGCGKTTPAVQWLIQCSGKPRFIPAPCLVERAQPKSWLPPIWEGCSAIVLDDVGTEKARDHARFLEEFGHLLTYVDATDKRLIITANMQMDTFRERYKERIESRFRQGGVWVSLTGGDMRTETRVGRR